MPINLNDLWSTINMTFDIEKLQNHEFRNWICHDTRREILVMDTLAITEETACFGEINLSSSLSLFLQCHTTQITFSIVAKTISISWELQLLLLTPLDLSHELASFTSIIKKLKNACWQLINSWLNCNFSLSTFVYVRFQSLYFFSTFSAQIFKPCNISPSIYFCWFSDKICLRYKHGATW